MRWKIKWKILKLLQNTLYKYGWNNWHERKTYTRNGIEIIVDNEEVLLLNEKYTEKLDHKKFVRNYNKVLVKS